MLLERLGRLLGAEDPEEGPPDERALHLASAILLFEVAKADHQLDRAEVERLQQVLREYWDLEQGTLDELLEIAERESDNAASLHRQLDLLNDSLSPQRKFQLMYGLWRIACADGQIDPYEEHLVRRLADLLYVPHREFIRAKLEALGD